MTRVFISYRRDDSGAHAGRLYDRLSAHFGADHVFRDIDDIQPGEDFTRVLDETVGRADALIALIGPKWLSPRLREPGDFVRREIEMGLRRNIPVFPVLVGGATMPATADLPEPLRPLARRHALEISDARYHEDTGRLIEALGGGRHFRNRKAVIRMLLAAASLVIAMLGAWMYQGSQPARSEPAPTMQKLRLRSGGASLTREQLNTAILRNNFYAKGVNEAGAPAAQFERRVIGEAVVVADAASGLMWQQGGSRKATDNAGASAIASAANSARFAGFDDWRLPTAEEALSLMAPKQPDGFYLNPLFDRMAAPFLWTSDRQSESRGWVIYYKDGIAATEPFTFNAPVRLVRTMK